MRLTISRLRLSNKDISLSFQVRCELLILSTGFKVAWTTSVNDPVISGAFQQAINILSYFTRSGSYWIRNSLFRCISAASEVSEACYFSWYQMLFKYFISMLALSDVEFEYENSSFKKNYEKKIMIGHLSYYWLSTWLIAIIANRRQEFVKYLDGEITREPRSTQKFVSA
jgi:hypothetical protein